MKTCMFILVLLTVLVTAAMEIRRDVHCRSGWTYFEGACYLFVSRDTDSWIEATTHCKVLHGELVDITSSSENSFIKSKLMELHKHDPYKPNTCYYTSGTDIVIDTHWIWSSTEAAMSFSDWGPGEPNTDFVEDCLCLCGSMNFQWADTSCQNKWNFICKSRINNEPNPDELFG